MRRRVVTAVALVASSSLVLAGCSDMREQVNGSSVEPDSQSDSPTVGITPLLETAEWAVTDGLLSVVVRNDNDRTVRTAKVALTAYSEQHAPVAAVAGDSMVGESGCCTVVDVAPGDVFGLYFALGDVVGAEVADIELAFSDIAYAETEAVDPPSFVATAQGTALKGSSTTVAATLQNGPKPVPLAVVQAVLRGRTGKLVAVVTGRWTCFAPEEMRPVRVELFQPVPRGTVVDTITARPLAGPNTPTCQR